MGRNADLSSRSSEQLAELGFLGVLIPHEYGGAGLGYMEYVAIVDELSRVDGSIGISVAAHNSLCTGHIFIFGTEEQKRKFVVPLAKGEKLGAWSLTEPEAGSDAGGTQTIARLDGVTGSLTARRLSPRTAPTAISALRWP